MPQLVADSNGSEARPIDSVAIVLLTISLGLAIDALLRRDGSLTVRAASIAGSASAAFLFGWQQWRNPNPLLDPRVFKTSAMAGVGALLTTIQFGYWAVLVYLPLFLITGLHVTMEVAGVALLAATLPMLLVPLIGGRLVTYWEWRHLFTFAFGLIAIGDVLLVIAALSSGPAIHLSATIFGMATIGVGAALVNPQMSGAVLALTPPAQLGMASAVTMIARQAGFAISVAVLGAMLGAVDATAAFAKPFTLAAIMALLGTTAALTLIPAKSTQHSASH